MSAGAETVEDRAGAPGLDMAIAAALLGLGWLMAAWLGFSLLDPNVSLDTRLSVLGMTGAYQAAAFLLAARARRARAGRGRT